MNFIECMSVFLIGVIVGYIIGMIRARKWWISYNGGYGRYGDKEEVSHE